MYYTLSSVHVAAIKSHSPEKPVLIFVSSRRQTRVTALDLIAFLAAEINPRQWLHMPDVEVRKMGLVRFLIPFLPLCEQKGNLLFNIC